MPPYTANEQLNQVINFFEYMAYMGNQGHLDDELAWSYYYYEADDLWKRAKDYILKRQKDEDDPTVWCEYGPWVNRLQEINTRQIEIKRRELKKLNAAVNLASPSATPADAPPPERPS